MSRYIISYQLKDHGKFQSYINSRQRSADANHTNAFKFFFFKVCLVFKRKIKMYKCSKQVYLISNFKKKNISVLDICCVWGEVCLCLLIEKSTNHFSRKKKVNRNFSRKMLLIVFFFVWYIVLVSVIMYSGMKCTKCAIFRSPTDHLQIFGGSFHSKKCAINRLYQIFTSKIFKGPLLGNKSKYQV